MTKIDDKIDVLIAKHPNLSKLDAIKLVADKNERKKKKRVEKTDRSKAKMLKNEENRP
ncbi:MAG: hypothetical protein ACI9QV_001480 [Methylophagaceae bacterium]|jgi:hypothetical protein